MSWIDFWNGAPPIYVSDRHRRLHYQQVARDLLRVIGQTGAEGGGASNGPATLAVLDYGSGEALYADEVARRCARLVLSDAAPTVRDGLVARFARIAPIEVVAPEALDGAIADASLDLVVVNSLMQYLDAGERDDVLALAHAKLKPGGRLIVADVVPEDGSAAADALALLRFGWAGGFLLAAGAGLARTAVSGYRRLRDELGFSTYSEAEFLRVLRAAGFEARRVRPNFGHNQRRMAFEATPRAA